jgi:hypothetical protein
VDSFLRAAARKVQFHVIVVAEGMDLVGEQSTAQHTASVSDWLFDCLIVSVLNLSVLTSCAGMSHFLLALF